MTEYDPDIALALDRLVPRPEEEPAEWRSLVEQARARQAWWRRWLPTRSPATRWRRAVVILAAAVTAMLLAIPALGLSEHWWFLDSGSPVPQGPVGVVTTGRASGIDWTMTAYLSKGKGICVALTPAVRNGTMGAESCGGAVRGDPVSTAGANELHSVGYVYFALSLYNFPDFLFGPVARGVDHVDVTLSDGQTIRARTVDPPQGLALPLRFYATPLPRGASVKSLVGRDASGMALEQRTCLECAQPVHSASP
jgi:hypothetical protein